MSRRRPQLRTTLLRGLAALVAVALLAGQLAGFAHRAEVAHASCDDHGELVDVGLLSPAEGREAQRHAAPASVEGAADQRSHGHDHCQLAPAQRERLAPSLDPACCGGPPALTAVALDSRAEVPAPSSLLLIAPKTSPPTAAV